MAKSNTAVVKKSNKKNVLIIVLLVLLAVMTFLAIFNYLNYQNVNAKYKEATMTKEDKIKNLVNEVSKLYNVPKYEDEQPSFPGVEGTAIYTIVEQDLENVKKTNEFYKDAQKDDVLIAYKNANTALLYRPSEKRIIKTGSYAESSLVKVQINVYASDSVAKQIESNLQQKFGKQVNVIINQPIQNPLAKGLVVDASGKSAEDAKKIAEALKYDIGNLPDGQKAPEGSAFVIYAPSQ